MALIEEIVIEYLNKNGLQYPAYGDMPKRDLSRNNPPDRFYLVEKTGNVSRDRLHTAQITVQSISAVSKAEAAWMNESMVAVMDGLSEHPAVFACRLNSDYDFTDTVSKRYRYQAVFDITYNREVLTNE